MSLRSNEVCLYSRGFACRCAIWFDFAGRSGPKFGGDRLAHPDNYTYVLDPLGCRSTRTFDIVSTSTKKDAIVVRLRLTSRMDEKQSAFCQALLENVAKLDEAKPFLRPVAPKSLGVPHYPQIVRHPLAIADIRWKIKQGMYSSIQCFAADIRHMLDNALQFNAKARAACPRHCKQP